MADGGQINLRLSLKGAEQVRAELAKMGPEGSRALRELDRGLRQPTAGLLALDAASGQVRNGLDDLASRGGAAGTTLGRLGPLGLAVAAGLGAVVLVLGAMVGRAREAMALAADLTDTANRIGVSTEALQRWSYVADEAGVPVQTLQQNMERLNGTLGRFKLGIGDGRLRPIFEELGITAAELEHVQTADQLMLLLADTLGQVRDQATAVRMAEAMGIRESLPILQLGSQRLRELMDAADDLGVVLDQRVVAELDAADRQLELAGQQMQNTITLGVAPLASSLGEAAEAWGRLMVRAQDFQAQAPALVQWLVRIAAAALPGGNAIRPGVEGVFAPRGPRDTFDPSRMDRGEMTDLRGRALLDSLSPSGGFELQGHTSGGSQSSAEQEARKAEQRRRALEDLAAELDLEEARLAGNQALVRELERQRAERQFMRRLQDLEVPQAQQLTMLEERRARLAAAQAEDRARATREIENQLIAEVARIDEAYSIEREQERTEELERRIEAYQRIYDLEEATRLAEADQAVVDEARERAARRWLDIAAEAHELELARLSGDREATRELERQNWLRERSLELQKAGRLVPREADEQAEREWAERESARRRGLLREGIQDFLEGVRRGNLEGFFESLADRFSSRLEERMADQLVPLFEQLANMLLNALTHGGRGGGGGWGDFLGQVMGAFGFGSSNPFGMGGGRTPGDFLPSTGVSGGNGGGPSIWNGAPLGAPSEASWSKAASTFDAASAGLAAALSKAHGVRPIEPRFAGVGAPVGIAPAGMRVEVNNYGSEPMQAEVRQTPNGAQVDLYPQFKGMMKRAGKDGTLEQAAALTPRPRRRG